MGAQHQQDGTPQPVACLARAGGRARAVLSLSLSVPPAPCADAAARRVHHGSCASRITHQPHSLSSDLSRSHRAESTAHVSPQTLPCSPHHVTPNWPHTRTHTHAHALTHTHTHLCAVDIMHARTRAPPRATSMRCSAIGVSPCAVAPLVVSLAPSAFASH